MVGPYLIFGLRPAEVMGDDHSVVAGRAPDAIAKMPFREARPGWSFLKIILAIPLVWMRMERFGFTDHDFGGLTGLAPSLEEHLRIQCIDIHS